MSRHAAYEDDDTQYLEPVKEEPRKRWVTRERLAWMAGMVAMAVLGGGVAYAAATPGSYNCQLNNVSNGFNLNCRVPGAPSPTPSVSPSTSPSSSPSASPSASPSVSPSASPTPSPSTTTPSPSPSVSPSPTPSPSTSSSPPAGTGCLARLAECGYPNAANTGPHGALAVVNGDVTLTAGATYRDKEVHGCIHVTGPGVTIVNVRVIAPDQFCVVGIEGSARNPGAARLTVTDAELICTVNGVEPGFATASGDRNFTFLRVNIHGCINGFDIDFEATIKDSWIHDLSCLGADPHSDGLQITQDATNVVVDHSVIDTEPGGPFCTTSAIISAPNDQVTVKDSLLAGGAYTVYCRGGAKWSVTNNRFGPAAFGTNTDCLGVPVWTGNVVDATGAPVLRAGP